MGTALTKCKYCEHGNPPDSKYCNACGATLTLAPCPHCGAVNDVKATSCYQCRGSLQERVKVVPVRALPAAAVPQSSPRQPSLAIVGTVVVASVAFIGYYAYRHYSLVSLTPSAVASTEAEGRRNPPQRASAPAPAMHPAGGVAASPASLVVPASAAAAPLNPPTTPQRTHLRVSRQLVDPPEAAAVAAPVALPQTSNPGKANEARPPRPGPCTEPVAALGLCTPKPAPVQEAQAVAAVAAATARPQSSDGGEPCTTAIAALGLCTPKSR